MAAVLSNGNEQFFVRGPKVAVFELPEAEIDVDVSGLKPDATEEIDANDILAEFSVDPEQPFELRVPYALHMRAAQLTAMLPRDMRAEPTPRRAGWILAAILGAGVGIGFAALIASYENAPIASAPAPHVLKASGATMKVLGPQRASVRALIPTVSFDSLPRARR